jgi:hypothetical protein
VGEDEVLGEEGLGGEGLRSDVGEACGYFSAEGVFG